MAKLIEEAQDHSLDRILNGFFAVPAFQRTYVWDRGFVRQFFDDLFSAYTEAPKRDYFIGSLVVYEHARRQQLVDGQQRMITLVTLFAACRDRVHALDAHAPTALYDDWLTGSISTRGARTRTEDRVLAVGEPDQEILTRIIAGEGPSMTPDEYEARQRTLAYAYSALADKLEQELPADHSEITRFAKYIAQRIRLVRIQTDSFSSALQIFETINARGKNLTPFELVKNHLFSLTPTKSEQSGLQARWETIAESIGQTLPPKASTVSAANVRFIRYFMMSQYATKKVVQANGVYDYVKSLLGKKPSSSEVADFSKLMEKSAKGYARLHDGRYPSGSQAKCEPIEDMAYIGPQLSQHYPFLMAALEHSHESVEVLAAGLERLMTVFLLAGEKFNKIESNIPDWCDQIRVSKSPAAMRQFVSTNIDKEIRLRRAKAISGLTNLGTLSSAAERYVLGQLTVYAQRLGGKPAKLVTHYDPDETIEHVLPQDPSGDWLVQYADETMREEYTYMIGNMCLVSRTINSSMQRALFIDPSPGQTSKRSFLANEPYFLTKSLATSVANGKNNKQTRLQAKLYTAPARSTWTAQDIEKRTEALVALAIDRWRI